MKRLLTTHLMVFGLLAVSVIPAARAQEFTIKTDDRWCQDDHKHWDGDAYRTCEVREAILPTRSELQIDASPNGGISVQAWDRNEILLRAKVSAAAESSARAEEIVGDISISTGRTIDADGPRTGNDEWFSVSFEVFAPASTNLELGSDNGGISIEAMSGRTRFETQNGGISLVDPAGDVQGKTVNGGVSIGLDGSEWVGEGLDVETTNGSIEIRVPNGYSALLETGTVNGRVKIDFPIMVEKDDHRNMTVTLGEGGRTIRAVTTNGSIRIRRE